MASSCGTVTNGSYSLGSDIGGYNGATACKNCVLSCNTGYEPNSAGTACNAATCPTGYAISTNASKCTTDIGTISNGGWELSSSDTNGYSGAESCKKCTPDCNSGYEPNSAGTDCIATTCPTGYAKSVSECSIIASPSQYSGYGFYYANVGKYTLGSKDAKGCGACIAECNSGYVLGLTDGVAPGVTLAACLPESCPTGYAKSVNECTTNKIIATPAQYNGYQFSPGSSGYFSLGSKDAKGCGACIANCNSSTALTNVASGLVACTGCPSGYYTSCPSVVDGTATKTSTCSGSLGGVSCCKCEITCRSGYVLNSSTGNCEFNAAAVLKVTVKAYARGSNNITVKLINTGNNSTTSKSVGLNGSSSASLLTSSVMEFSGVYSGSTYSLVVPQANGCVGVGALISDYDSSDCYLQSSFDFSRYGSQYGMPGQCYYPGTYNNSTGVLFTLAPGTTDVVVYVQCS